VEKTKSPKWEVSAEFLVADVSKVVCDFVLARILSGMLFATFLREKLL
jgi:hypothetical protein